MSKYLYRLKALNDNSQRYGDCEICRGYASEMYIQTERKKYYSKRRQEIGYSHQSTLFGHKKCLKTLQK